MSATQEQDEVRPCPFIEIEYRHMEDWDTECHASTSESDGLVTRQRRKMEIKDRNGTEIYEGDTLRFVDKASWYRNDMFRMWLQDKPQGEINEWLDAQPFEERVIEFPQSYEWLLSSEIQSEWEVVKP